MPGKDSTASFMCISSLAFTTITKTTLGDRGYHQFHFTSEESEVQRG